MCVKCNMCNKRNKLLKGRIVEKLNGDSLISIKQPDDPLPVKFKQDRCEPHDKH